MANSIYFLFHLQKKNEIQPLTHDKNQALSTLNFLFDDDELNVPLNIKFVCHRIENIVSKGENVGYQHFLLFPSCFRRLFRQGLHKSALWQRIKKKSNIWSYVSYVGLCSTFIWMIMWTLLRYPQPEDRVFFLNRVISVISIVLRETTLTTSDSSGELVLIESEIMRVVYLCTTEISEITRLKIRSSRFWYLNVSFTLDCTIHKNITQKINYDQTPK